MKISVIIPLYNQRSYVSQAIESILNQSYKDIEIIVVDDDSTDVPNDELKKHDKSIKLIRQNNKGLSEARNTGIKNASGEYIQFLDADDTLHPDKIKTQLNYMKQKHSRLSYCEIAQLDHETGLTHLRYIGPIDDMFLSLYTVWLPYPLPIHSMIFKRDLFSDYGAFDSTLRAAEDRYFLSILALNKERFDYYPFIGGNRRLHEKNMNKDRLHIYKNMISYYHKISDIPHARQLIKKKYNFNSQQMMEANLTCMYLSDIAGGIPLSTLNKIKTLFRNNNIHLNYEPIPKTFGVRKSNLQAFRHRWIHILKKKVC